MAMLNANKTMEKICGKIKVYTDTEQISVNFQSYSGFAELNLNTSATSEIVT